MPATLSRLTLLHCVQTGVGGASSDVEGASTCDHLQSSDVTCDPQATLDNLAQDFGYDNEPQPTPLQLHAILQGGHAPLSRFIGTCRVQLHSLLRNEHRAQRSVWRHLARVSTATRARAGPARRERTSNHG